MNTKRLKEYLQEIDKLKKLDWDTSIKINQQFKDRKEQEERNKKTNINYVSNCCGFGLDESNLICLKCFEGCEPTQEETQTNNFDNRLKNFINNLK
tara:strand:- start:517 stop:804 length:288 start_codon:yes stop_codon:yes gene_type:complete